MIETKTQQVKTELADKLNDLKEKASGLPADTSKKWQDALDDMEADVYLYPRKVSGKEGTLRGNRLLIKNLDVILQNKLSVIEQEIDEAIAEQEAEREVSEHEKIEDQDQQDDLAQEKQERRRNKEDFDDSVKRLKGELTDFSLKVRFTNRIHRMQAEAMSEDFISEESLGRLENALRSIAKEIEEARAEQEAEREVSERAARKKQYALSAVATIVSGGGVWYGAEKLCQMSSLSSSVAASLVGIAVGLSVYKMCSKNDVEKDIGVELQDQSPKSSAGSEQFGM